MNAKYVIDTEENKRFMNEQTMSLLEFGRKFPSPAGSSYYLGDDGSPWINRPRETWITSRMAHVYSIGSMLGVEGCDELADKALMGLMGELHDRINDGWYSGINPDGSVIPGKACYAHAFVILAATSLRRAGRPHAGELLYEALDVYDRYFWDKKRCLASDTWNTEFTICDPYRGLNSVMHSVEAFLAVSDATNDESYRERAGNIIRHVVAWASINLWRLPEHYNENWVYDIDYNKDRPDDQFKPYGATPGHAIEWSRLIVQWVTSFHKEGSYDYKFYLEAAEKLFCRAVEDAWNKDGAPGIVYTTNWRGEPVVHDRMHWTLAEAINTSAVLYRATGKMMYADFYYDFVKYLDECVLDKVNGSWFHQLDRNNQVIDTVWPGKADIYHAFQASIIPYNKINTSIATAVSNKKR